MTFVLAGSKSWPGALYEASIASHQICLRGTRGTQPTPRAPGPTRDANGRNRLPSTPRRTSGDRPVSPCGLTTEFPVRQLCQGEEHTSVVGLPLRLKVTRGTVTTSTTAPATIPVPEAAKPTRHQVASATAKSYFGSAEPFANTTTKHARQPRPSDATLSGDTAAPASRSGEPRRAGPNRRSAHLVVVSRRAEPVIKAPTTTRRVAFLRVASVAHERIAPLERVPDLDCVSLSETSSKREIAFRHDRRFVPRRVAVRVGSRWRRLRPVRRQPASPWRRQSDQGATSWLTRPRQRARH